MLTLAFGLTPHCRDPHMFGVRLSFTDPSDGWPSENEKDAILGARLFSSFRARAPPTTAASKGNNCPGACFKTLRLSTIFRCAAETIGLVN